MLYKRYAFLLALLAAADAVAGPSEWKIEKSKHFIVYYHGDESVAKGTVEKAEGYYRDILRELGLKRYDDFWLWDKRVQIRIYDSLADFRTATGSPAWAGGKASYVSRQIEGVKGENDFLEGLLPHEMTHLIFRDYIGFAGDVPLWLEEGVASWVAASRRDEDMATVQVLHSAGKLFPLDKLVSMDVKEMASAARARQFYAQSATLVAFLMQNGGSDQFAVFCRELRDNKAVDQALKSAYGERLGSVAKLEAEWLLWLPGKSTERVRS